ncbi:MAG: hypothetical protein K0U84_24305 [Actinomycetia bacterium]|nr:hypothetical protein [Actinomycetes bacterium]
MISGSGSIFTRALELQAEARKRGDSANDTDNALRVATEVENAEKVLSSLRNSLDLVAALRSQDVEIAGMELDSGLKNFEKHAGKGGLPSRQAVQSATKKIAEVQQRVSATFGSAWRDWAANTIQQLPTDRLALIGQGRAGPVNQALDAMRSARFQVPTDSSAIAQFVRYRDMVRRELLSVEDPGPHLREVLKQLQDGTTLDQLTDDDIAVLRTSGWEANIRVKRADVD